MRNGSRLRPAVTVTEPTIPGDDQAFRLERMQCVVPTASQADRSTSAVVSGASRPTVANAVPGRAVDGESAEPSVSLCASATPITSEAELNTAARCRPRWLIARGHRRVDARVSTGPVYAHSALITPQP